MPSFTRSGVPRSILRAQLGFGDDVDGVGGQEAQLAVDVHDRGR